VAHLFKWAGSGRVGPGDCSPVPLTEPDLWAHIRLFKLGISKQRQLFHDPRRVRVTPVPDWTTTPLVPTEDHDSRRNPLSRRPFRSPNCYPLVAARTNVRRIRPLSVGPRSLSGCRQTRISVGMIRNFSTCHPLRSTGITRFRRYYEMIRLLDQHQLAVVSFVKPTKRIGPETKSLGSIEISRGKTQ
jgi:hypothetical protein